MIPAVSVHLTSFNRLELLKIAVDSVFAQTFGDWELVITDDGSEQPTRDYLRSLLGDARVRVVWLEHCGNLSVVRNAGLAATRAPLVAFLDSDDWWLPHKLATQLAAMAGQPQRLWSYTREILVDTQGAPVSNPGYTEWLPYQGQIAAPLLRVEAMISAPTVIVARALLDAAGGFDPEQRYVGDYELWVRLALRSDVIALSEPLTCVRIHRDHYTKDRVQVHRMWVRLYGKLATLVPARLRAICLSRRAASMLRVAVGLWIAGERREALATAWKSMRAGWPYGHWWLAVLRTARDAVRRSLR